MPSKYTDKNGVVKVYKYDMTKYKKPKKPKEEWKQLGRPKKLINVIRGKLSSCSDEQLLKVINYVENIILLQQEE